MQNEFDKLFDEGSCLSLKQLGDYVAGKIIPQESYIIEKHLNNCRLCSDAVEGMQWAKENSITVTSSPLTAALMDAAQRRARVSKHNRLQQDEQQKINARKEILLKANPVRKTQASNEEKESHGSARPFYKNPFRVAAAAALLVLMIGSGYGIFRFLSLKDDTTALPTLAQNEKSEMVSMDTFITNSSPQNAANKAPANNPSKIKQEIPPALAGTDIKPQKESELDQSSAADVEDKNTSSPTADRMIIDAAPASKKREQLAESKKNDEKNLSKTVATQQNTASKETGSESKNREEVRIKSSESKQDQQAEWLSEGIVAYKEGKNNLAHSLLNKVIAQPESPLLAEAQYYKALTYLQSDQQSKAKVLLQILAEKGGTWGRKSKRLLKTLK